MSTHTATIPKAEHLLSRVELAVDTAGWPAGTTGTLVETFPREGFVEIVDDEGRSLDILTVPYAALRLHDVDR
jgi:hypothetical protein